MLQPVQLAVRFQKVSIDDFAWNELFLVRFFCHVMPSVKIKEKRVRFFCCCIVWIYHLLFKRLLELFFILFVNVHFRFQSLKIINCLFGCHSIKTRRTKLKKKKWSKKTQYNARSGCARRSCFFFLTCNMIFFFSYLQMVIFFFCFWVFLFIFAADFIRLKLDEENFQNRDLLVDFFHFGSLVGTCFCLHEVTKYDVK